MTRPTRLTRLTRLGTVYITDLMAGTGVALLARPIVTFGSLLLAHLSGFAASQLWWFASSNPAGVKLHPQLSSAFSMAGLWYIASARDVCVALGNVSVRGYNGEEYNVFHGVVLLVGILTALKGSHVLGRAAGLPTLPITLASAAMYHTARAHLRLTGLLWRYMLEEGSAYKLALSCLLFMPVVLTLPTTLWYGIFVCGMGAVAEFATRSAATLLVVHALRAGPLVGGPIGSFLPLTRARGETT